MSNRKDPKLFFYSTLMALILSTGMSSLVADDQSIVILEETWDKTQSSKNLADATYARLKQSGSLNPFSSYAYLLAKIKQSDIRKAIPAAEALLELDPGHLQAHYAKTWLLILMKKHESAMTALVEFDKVNDLSSSISAEERLANVRTIGRLFGFLSGPMRDNVSDVELRLTLESILKVASEDERNAFTESQLSVIEKHKSLLNEKSETLQASIEQGEKEQADTLVRLEKESDVLAEREKTLAPQIETITREGKSDLARIRAQAKPLEAEYRRLDSQAAGVRSELNSVLNDALYYEHLARREEDPVLRDSYLRQAGRLRSIARELDSTLGVLIRRAENVSAALARVQAEHAATEANYNAKLNQVRKTAEDIKKQQKRIEAQVKRASRPVTGITGGSKALQNRATGITTYDVFPVEREKARLLEILKSK